jgi:thioredoxin 1
MDDEIIRLREKRMQEIRETMAAGKSGVTHLDEMTFGDFVQAHPFAVVDFWAEWCGPCRRVGPVIDELAGEFAGRVAFAKVDTDANQRLSMEYAISAIPAILLFSHGHVADRIIGAYPKEEIRAKIAKAFVTE